MTSITTDMLKGLLKRPWVGNNKKQLSTSQVLAEYFVIYADIKQDKEKKMFEEVIKDYLRTLDVKLLNNIINNKDFKSDAFNNMIKEIIQQKNNKPHNDNNSHDDEKKKNEEEQKRKAQEEEKKRE